MHLKSALLPLALGVAMIAGPVMAGPEAGHPNIIAARESAERAIEKLHAAQVANEYDMGGHAAKAEKLLSEALHQMKLAAEAANKHERNEKK